MTDAEFISAFEMTTLPRPLWTHEAHVRMAYLYLKDNPDADALLPLVRERIRALNQSYGNPNGYHETVTRAFLYLVADAVRCQPELAATWETFREAHPGLLCGMDALRPFYTVTRLATYEARTTFMPPDIALLP